METYIAQCQLCKRDIYASERFDETALDMLAGHMSRSHGVDLWKDGYGEREQAGDVLRHYTVRSESSEARHDLDPRTCCCLRCGKGPFLERDVPTTCAVTA